MTINELLAAAGLTGDDVIPMYDAEAPAGTEPTQKIKASDFVSAMKTLGSLLSQSDVVNNLTNGSTNPVSSGGVYTALAIVQTNLTNNLTGGLTGNLEIVRTGKVVGMGYTDLSCSSNIAAGTQVCSGFPAPISTVVFILASTSGVYRCLLDASGKLTAGAAIPSGYYRLCGTYITNT